MSKDVAMATNFMARNTFIICAGILQRLGRSRNLYPYRDSGCTLYVL